MRLKGTSVAAGALVAAMAAVHLVAPTGSAAQVFQGRVLDVADEAPVSTALVRLLDVAGKDVGFALADALGRYRVVAPAPGTYRLVAERLGYGLEGTPLLAVSDPDGVYPVDLELRRVAVAIPGITVSVERQGELERAIRLAIGTDPRSLRTPPIPRRVIEDHLDKGHTLVDLIRWTNAPIVVHGVGRDTCFEYRRACMTVYLNGVRLDADFWDTLPLDMVETIVILAPLESEAYGTSLLLYTGGWLR